MTGKTIGFVGGGRIARIFLEGWRRAEAFPERVVVSDASTDTLSRLKTLFPGIETTNQNATAAAQEIVFLAVHPPAMADVVGSIRSGLDRGTIVVSLAPKFTISKLTELLGGFQRIARVIPNAPSFVNFGFNPVAFAPGFGAAEREIVLGLLRPLGECPEVDERKLEGYAVLTAMAPTFFWFQLQTLRELGSSFGLTEDDMAPAMKRMVCGSARTLLESGLAPSEVMDLVPVKPLGDIEEQAIEFYRTRLPAVYQKIKP